MADTNKILKKNFYFRLGLIAFVIVFLLFAIDGKLNDWGVIHDFLKEFVIVVGAAVLVSSWFERKLRMEISEEVISIIEAKEEFGKAGILKYYPNFEDIIFREYLDLDVKNVDFYLIYGHSLFTSIADKLEKLCAKEGVVINIYMFSKENPFLVPFGALWGAGNADYNFEGIIKHIDMTLNLLRLLFQKLEDEKKLKAKIKIHGLKHHPVSYSFYRFDDELLFVPTKLIEPKSFRPAAFLTRKTISGEGIYNKCMFELAQIISNNDALELIYDSTT